MQFATLHYLSELHCTTRPKRIFADLSLSYSLSLLLFRPPLPLLLPRHRSSSSTASTHSAMSTQFLLDTGPASCPPTADDVFGPVISGCRQNFDFTLLFEQSILSLLPATLLLLVAPLRLLQLYKASVKTRSASVGQIKLVSLC